MTTSGAVPFAGFEALIATMLAEAARRRKSWGMGNAAEMAFERLEHEADLLADATRDARARSEAARFLRHLDCFRAVDCVLGVTWASLRWLEDSAPAGCDPPLKVRYATAALGTRAISTAHEVSALLRAGFANGARARWRTLYEIDVMAAVLAMGNRGTAARYVNHRWVELSRRPHNYLAPDRPDLERYAQQQAKLYLRRYGKSFGGQYGWAAEITNRRLGVEKPKLSDLERLAARYLGDHSQRVVRAHQLVHPSSIGALDSVDASGTFHAGADDGLIHVVCADLMLLLSETVANLIMVWRRYEGRSSKVEIIQALVVEAGLVGYGVAFDAASSDRLTC